MKKILAIVQHRKDRSPGQRFRFEHYIPILEKNGYEIIFSNIISEKDDEIFYSKRKYFKKLLIVIKAFAHRLKDIKTAKNCDIIFIYREAFMLGATYFEKRLSKLDVPIIFDFDDSIWLNDTSEGNQNLAWLKKPQKTAKICKLSDLVIVGNHYLANYAKQHNPNVEIIPTTINTDYHKPECNKIDSDRICIGWTGTTTTLKHYYTAIPVLKKIKEKYGEKVYFKVIVNSKNWTQDLDVKLVNWTKEQEIEDLCEFDIGIMPLPDDEWSKGKCGFKGLQCMALGISVVMSPVGVNSEIIENGVNGYLAEKNEVWFNYLCQLIESSELRKTIGNTAKKTVEEKYSVNVWEKRVLGLFEKYCS
ncbi:MAG: glycosyltransferase family 4 protein [Bacteroidales bacterium]|nr:glycosyltransferase family 4 protein [Bacteroidales bacterium]MDD4215965.1 glycosyltransferase family 4 protein [Bacteroidales bacterium]